MEIPIMSENALTTLGNQVENGFDSSTKEYAEERFKRGIFAMELLLGVGEDNTEDCFYYEVKKNYVREKTINKSKYAIAVVLGIITGFAMCALPIVIAFVTYKIWGTAISVCVAIIVFITIMLIMGAIGKKSDRKMILDYSNKSGSNFNAWDMYETCTKSSIDSSNSDLDKICEKLGINPTEAKVGLGKVKGGGSTWIGWGSGAAIGAGIGLSMLSGIGASVKNSAINDRIKELENYVFYNNVASYFNSEILPEFLSSQSELLNMK